MAKRWLFTGVAVSAAVFAATASSAAQQGSPDQPPGDAKAKALVERVCSGCHDLGVISDKGRTAEDWQKVVDLMADRGAQATDAEFDQITAYLAKTQPASPPPAPAPATPPAV
jgi:hypothetical protein